MKLKNPVLISDGRQNIKLYYFFGKKKRYNVSTTFVLRIWYIFYLLETFECFNMSSKNNNSVQTRGNTHVVIKKPVRKTRFYKNVYIEIRYVPYVWKINIFFYLFYVLYDYHDRPFIGNILGITWFCICYILKIFTNFSELLENKQ